MIVCVILRCIDDLSSNGQRLANALPQGSSLVLILSVGGSGGCAVPLLKGSKNPLQRSESQGSVSLS